MSVSHINLNVKQMIRICSNVFFVFKIFLINNFQELKIW